MEHQEPPFPQRLEMQLQGVAIGAGQRLRVADADPSVVAGVVEQPDRQVRQAGWSAARTRERTGGGR